MNKFSILVASLLTAALCLSTNPKINAQNPPAKTYQPGDWQPKARFANPQEGVKVIIVNKTLFPLQYGLSTGDALSAEIPVGGRATLTTNVLPEYILIYPKQSNIELRYSVSTKGNVATVDVQQTNDISGDSTLNLHESGAIYVY